ncbi:MAG: UDP-N-acetylmuramoyl-tripeptide--D-alanyl-D-alanine ligase [Peptoniphilaceae bacterium]|nr:UDP-N-acetylmuramoyl-tripeptide--D-alanyl-D-alanine ligase [Peptoniphilaceae bacterium]MDY6085771.1 UDP-N-acetylmuramoyl-tripeptide--D-alanyl-D-alanine ligase [Peptoniphilaceae bacterium]
MKQQTLGSIAELAGATLTPASAASTPVKAISIDTRTIDTGDVYMPIIGERLDGHQFIEGAFEKGAVACFHDAAHPIDADKPLLTVDDTTAAFTRLAQHFRETLDVKMIGITGSNGKTTTKDIVYSVLRHVFRTKKTTGNLNNQIGVPRTLLQLDEDTEVAVVEMGMSEFGEISHLTHLVHPDIAVITNVGAVHLEQLKTQENVAQAKLEILEGMGPEGLFLYNYDNEILRDAVAARDITPRVVSYGTADGADVKISLVKATPIETAFTLDGTPFTVDLIGAYQMYNAAVAVIIARELGLTDAQIQDGLKVSDRTPWRTELGHFDGFDILIDVYKSNPPSLREALETAALLQGYNHKIAILGDMLELGRDELDIHREIGRKLNPDVFDAVLFYGALSKAMYEGALENFGPERAFHFSSKPDLVDQAKYLIRPNTLVLIKGSRAMRLEEVVESLSGVTAR